MKDKIFLEGLEINCVIGIFDWERKIRQKIVVDFDIPIDAGKAARRDDIRQAVDYKAISKRIIDFTKKGRFQLIETLADRLASTLLKEFRLKEIRLRVSKPGAIRGSKNVGVEVMRRK